MRALSSLPADRVPPGIEKLAGKAALLRYFLSENHRSGVRHRIPVSVDPGASESIATTQAVSLILCE